MHQQHGMARRIAALLIIDFVPASHLKTALAERLDRRIEAKPLTSRHTVSSVRMKFVRCACALGKTRAAAPLVTNPLSIAIERPFRQEAPG